VEERGRKHLTAKRKFNIYLETRQPGAKIGEILRRERLHLNDLRSIEELAERGAIGALKSKGPGRGIRKKIDPLEYQQLKQELAEKEKAMTELMVEHMLLKKSERWASSEDLMNSGSEKAPNGKHSLKPSRMPSAGA
jgi:hypothetical protein